MLLIILSTSPQLISSGQYGCDHQSRLEKSKDNQLNFYLNDCHHEYSIELSIKSNQVPIILQKLKEDYSGIDLIHLGYIPYPIEDCDPDALLQKVLQEIQEQQQVLKILNKDKKIFFTLYKDDL
ncbi:unnamed protein product [Paramecium primaurelia]|uniref:Uncharacterized protein n=1 Tax=Paramecium primaurelia TaxID=5886 RepID=A0A8S1KXA8_PARPR|nr:unnamed protein product [Paramecium primaurelia]